MWACCKVYTIFRDSGGVCDFDFSFGNLWFGWGVFVVSKVSSGTIFLSLSVLKRGRGL